MTRRVVSEHDENKEDAQARVGTVMSDLFKGGIP